VFGNYPPEKFVLQLLYTAYQFMAPTWWNVKIPLQDRSFIDF